ncbi:MAG: hypothetical protein KH327_06650 [Peptoniphilus harei]|uniref:Putative DNA-binding domain-containing protein n=1 Tax=Peptoniphilus harei TaxID=54005 RepID=A0A943SQ68_9FIRM|nr:hypothetical protein [Peptoniphilus harei]
MTCFVDSIFYLPILQFLLEKPDTKDTQRRQLDTLLDTMSDKGIRIVTARAKEIKEVEKSNKPTA